MALARVGCGCHGHVVPGHLGVRESPSSPGDHDAGGVRTQLAHAGPSGPCNLGAADGADMAVLGTELSGGETRLWPLLACNKVTKDRQQHVRRYCDKEY